MTTVRATSDAFTADANLWQEVSEVLFKQSSNAASMMLEAGQMPARGDIDVSYSQVQAKIHELLRDGATQALAVSTELLYIQNRFTSTDQTVRDSLHGLWDPRKDH